VIVAGRLDEIIETFQSVDPEMRLELLLDFARRLPPLDREYHAARDAGLHGVPECMTPVFLHVTKESGTIRLHAAVGEEAPTVKGFVGILHQAFDRAPAAAVAAAPADLVHRLGLAEVLRMNRTVGLSAIVSRVKAAAAKPE
jgi:cysteine desulfuration protein SufE